MAKPKSVNKYRSGTKNPHQEVHVYRDNEVVKVHVIDWEKGTVTSFEKKNKEEAKE